MLFLGLRNRMRLELACVRGPGAGERGAGELCGASGFENRVLRATLSFSPAIAGKIVIVDGTFVEQAANLSIFRQYRAPKKPHVRHTALKNRASQSRKRPPTRAAPARNALLRRTMHTNGGTSVIYVVTHQMDVPVVGQLAILAQKFEDLGLQVVSFTSHSPLIFFSQKRLGFRFCACSIISVIGCPIGNLLVFR